MRTYKLVYIFSLLLSLPFSAALGADSLTEVDTLLKNGVQLRREGNHSSALGAFLKAHALSPSGRSLAQIGLARQSLHQWLEAETSLRLALETLDPWVEKHRRALENTFADIRKHIGSLLVLGAKDTRVFINEVYMGDLPMKELRLDEGYSVVRVEREGYKPWSQTVRVEGGKTTEMVAMLVKENVAPKIADEPNLKMEASASQASGSQTQNLIGSGLFGGGLAVALVGATIWIHQASGYYGDFNSGNTGPSMVAGGIVGLALGAVLMYTSEDKTIAVGLTSRGPMVAGRF